MLRDRKVIIGIVIIVVLISLLLLRGVFVRGLVSKKIDSVERRYSLSIDYQKLTIRGFANISLKGLSVKPLDNDTLFMAKEIDLKVNPFKLLILRFDIKSLNADNIKFNFVKRDSSSNYDFFFKVANHSTSSTAGTSKNFKQNYLRNFDNLLAMIFGFIPKNAQIINFLINYNYDEYYLKVSTPEIKVAKNFFSATVFTDECGHLEQLLLKGYLNENERKVSAKICSTGNKEKFSVPFINFKWGAALQFNSLAFDFVSSQRKNGVVDIEGLASIEGLSLFHEKISPEYVRLEEGNLDFKMKIGENYIELDSSSVVKINELTFSPFLKAVKHERWHITASVDKRSFPAQQLFASLPKGLFHNLEGMEVTGNLDYHFLLDLDFANIDSLKLESNLIPHNFKILKFGKTDLRHMNGEFEYIAYEQGMPVRKFMVGPSNPNFRRLDQISPILQMAVLQSEDGGFFYHNGFLPEAIRGALVTNIKDKKFRRGGSTISMQLVKNVFLSRNKTLARKAEEMLIVWLIENNRLTTKERMFEVYLNIIEWGPMVYGANEASRFYFNKDVGDLNINEAIFLAGIIPSPKRSLNNFTADGVLISEKMDGYFRLLAERLRVKGVISESEEVSVKPEIKLAGESFKIVRQREMDKDSSYVFQ